MSARLDDFIGQHAIKDLIRAKIQFAHANAVALPHLLLCGEKESGRKRFAEGIANQMEVPFDAVAAESFKKLSDFTATFFNICEKQILVISEIDLLSKPIVDVLSDVLLTAKIDIVIGSGPEARTHSIGLPVFTLVGTTTKPWLVDQRLRQNCIPCEFSNYSLEETAGIALQIGAENGLTLTQEAALDIAERCGCQPGAAALLLHKIARSFRINPSDRIDQARLREIAEFFGSGGAYPASLALCERLQSMTGIEFEHWVADLFRQAGFRVEVTQASGDHGVDLWAHTGADLVAVQCKRWNDAVGEPVIKDLYGAVAAASAKAGYLVTTGTFTAQAQQFAQGKMLVLVGLDKLMEAVKVPSLLHERLGPTK
jgi:hypothetical protein